MAKTVHNPRTGEMKRVEPHEAMVMVEEYGWRYASKDEWKKYRTKESQQANKVAAA